MSEVTGLTELPQAVSYISYSAGSRLLILPGQIGPEPILAELSEYFLITCWLPATMDRQTQLQWNALASETLTGIEPVRIQGYLGQFSVEGLDGYRFDLVLDMQDKPSVNSTISPPGYYRTQDSLQTLEKIVGELPAMIGEFDKPKFFYLNSEKCAHSRREIEGCRQCIDACATDAIGIAGDVIQVNPYLCQGCGDCATVCPAGAINYQFPKRSDILQTIKSLFARDSAVLLLYGGETPAIEVDFPVKPLELESLGSCGIDVWLGALAYGASQVWLVDGGELTHESQKALNEQIAQARAILSGLGYPELLIQLANADGFVPINGPGIERAIFAPDTDKRTMIRLAVDHLASQVDRPPQSCRLPEAAAFGAIEVAREECTLCMSCVSVCPEQALLAGGETPQLKFIEANCVQCGICSKACPEQVISLTPRYLYDSQAARKPKLLHQELAFHCIECGAPFAAQSMIDAILKKLEHHPMFQGDKKRQLMLCEQCKVVAMFEKKP